MYIWEVMPFGLKDDPNICNPKMKTIFEHVLQLDYIKTKFGEVEKPDNWLYIYVDDILITAQTSKELEIKVHVILEVYRQNKLVVG